MIQRRRTFIKYNSIVYYAYYYLYTDFYESSLVANRIVLIKFRNSILVKHD